ncbi:hypothetical protein IFR05_015089 [Cadophora sp. M221]|nr:hypothetical protein IFR05_015089 [Cadophora sp. M221]
MSDQAQVQEKSPVLLVGEIQGSRSNNNNSRVQIAQLSQVLSLTALQPAQKRLPSSLCDHCGGLTPRSGATTVYGTPLRTPTASGWNSETSSIFSDAKGKEKVEVTNSSVCLVERLHLNDDVDHMPKWKKRVNRLTPISSFLAVVSYWIYFAFRIQYTIAAQRVANRIFVYAWIFVVIEMGVAFPSLMIQLWQSLAVKGRTREKLRIVGDTVPTIDVFITCCGEDIDVVLDTARAAAAVDWPFDRFRVVVLDDGGSSDLQSAIEDLAIVYPNMYYTARVKTKGVPHHYKAGNLNHGLQFVHGLPGGAGEFMAALDADMIPEPEWLRAIIAHLVIDSDLALSCPPQLFYNVPPNDPLMQSLDGFVHIFEPVKDTGGVAWCTGSGYAIRRSAIDQLGGFPTGSLAEDVCTSTMLLGAGWKTAYIHEPLQFGTVPETFAGHVKQRTRWTIGSIQTSVKLNFGLFGPLVTKMTFLQRLSGFVYTITTFFSIFHTMALFTMPLVLISGGRLVAYATNYQLRWLIRMCFVALISNRVNEWAMYLPAGYRLGQRDSGAVMWMAPYHALTIIRSFILPTWLGGKVAAFTATGGLKSELNERDPHRRAPLGRRLKVILFGNKVFMHLIYLLFCFAAVAKSTANGVMSNKGSASGTLVYMLTHACWPPMAWLIALNAAWAPIHYAIWPPSMPDREHLLARDEITGVAHPTAAAKRIVWDKTYAFHEIEYSLLTVYTTVIFIGTFFF